MFSLSLSQVNRGDSLSSLKLTEVRLAVLSETLTLGNGGMGYGHVKPWGMLGYVGWYGWVWLGWIWCGMVGYGVVEGCMRGMLTDGSEEKLQS